MTETIKVQETATVPVTVHRPAEQKAEVSRALTPRQLSSRPVVVRFKKKRRYSRSLKGIQRVMRHGSKVTSRLTSAIADGLVEYRRRATKSSRNKKDGMLRDFLKNSARGMSKTLRKSSRVPFDLARTVKSKTIRRNIRRMRRLAMFPSPVRLLF